MGDRYRLLEPLGNGGMAVVWRAEDNLLGREVAVKVLSAEVSADPETLHRMYAEARAAAGLRHDNVVEVYDYGQTDISGVPMPYVVMELVEGRPLSDLLAAGALPWKLATLIGAQVASALAAAHDHGIVHRDVKPANVMVAAGGVKLVDFGISAAVGELEKAADHIIGTPAYLAPERLAGGMVRPATDVYALGLLLYMMLVGRMPWNASTSTQMLRAHRYQQPAPLPPITRMPAEITELVHACLSKAPSDRPAAVAAARTLRKAAGLPPLSSLTDLGDHAAAAGPPTEPVAPTTGTAADPGRRTVRARFAGLPARRRVILGGALLAAAVTAGLAIWPLTPHRSPAAAADPPAAAADAPACRVTYLTKIESGGRATTAVSVANTGPAAPGTWTLTFRLPGDQRLVQGRHAVWTQSGEVVRATGTGAASGVSFTAKYRGAVALPQSFAVNDVVCDAQMSVRGATVTPAPSAATVTPAPSAPTVTPARDTTRVTRVSQSDSRTKAKSKPAPKKPKAAKPPAKPGKRPGR